LSCARAPSSASLYDKRAKKVTGGEEYEQPAGMVVLSSFVFGNVQLLLLAGILCRSATAPALSGRANQMAPA
jgi:hypothetical protein